MTPFFTHLATSVHLRFTPVCAPEWAGVATWSVWELLGVIVFVSVGGLFVASRLLGGRVEKPWRDDFDADRVRRTKR